MPNRRLLKVQILGLEITLFRRDKKWIAKIFSELIFTESLEKYKCGFNLPV
jgi:hypothetical protein